MRHLQLALVLTLLLGTSALSAAYDVSSSIRELAALYRINPEYMLALGEVESNLRHDAVGTYGERGPLQVLPSTFRALGGKNIGNWRETTSVGVLYFSKCLKAAKGDYRLAAIYYNAGIGNKNDRARRYASKVSRSYHRRRETVHRSSRILPIGSVTPSATSTGIKVSN
jgi:soluble lytic murein transglycosylase-like protein